VGPSDARHRLPVLVWIHGGSFVGGSGSQVRGDARLAHKLDQLQPSLHLYSRRNGWANLHRLGQPNKPPPPSLAPDGVQRDGHRAGSPQHGRGDHELPPRDLRLPRRRGAARPDARSVLGYVFSTPVITDCKLGWH
jgi:hypothetical protein